MSYFIAFEGLDGAGKSSLIRKLSEELQRQQVKSYITREPGGTSLGEKVRTLLLENTATPPCPRAELLLYEAIRAQHVDEKLRPLIEQKTWILCDRYMASTVAFQSAGRNLDRAAIDWLNAFAVDGLKPNLTILLDLDVGASRERLDNRVKTEGTEHDRFELEKSDFHQRVRASYLEQAKQDPDHWCVLDASKPTEVLFQELLKNLKNKKWLHS